MDDPNLSDEHLRHIEWESNHPRALGCFIGSVIITAELGLLAALNIAGNMPEVVALPLDVAALVFSGLMMYLAAQK
jgi:hypothetical protein